MEIGQVQAELDSLQVHIDTLNANRDVMKSPAHVETLTCPYERVVVFGCQHLDPCLRCLCPC